MIVGKGKENYKLSFRAERLREFRHDNQVDIPVMASLCTLWKEVNAVDCG